MLRSQPEPVYRKLFQKAAGAVADARGEEKSDNYEAAIHEIEVFLANAIDFGVIEGFSCQIKPGCSRRHTYSLSGAEVAARKGSAQEKDFDLILDVADNKIELSFREAGRSGIIKGAGNLLGSEAVSLTKIEFDVADEAKKEAVLNKIAQVLVYSADVFKEKAAHASRAKREEPTAKLS